jgi:hypothetical protein
MNNLAIYKEDELITSEEGKRAVEMLKERRKQTNAEFKERYDRGIPKWIKAAYKVFQTDHYIEEKKFHLKKSINTELSFLLNILENTKDLDQSIKDSAIIKLKKLETFIKDNEVKLIYDAVGKKILNPMRTPEQKKAELPRYSLIDIHEIDDGFKSISDEFKSLNTKVLFTNLPEARSCFNRIDQTLIQLSKIQNPDVIKKILYQGSIEYLDDSGQIATNMKYGGGIQQFLEIKFLGSTFSDFSLSFRSFSFNRYIRETDKLFGLSGTSGLGDDFRDFQIQLWNLEEKPVVLPDFKAKQLTDSETKE